MNEQSKESSNNTFEEIDAIIFEIFKKRKIEPAMQKLNVDFFFKVR